jgi:hypothetical protein
MINMNLASPNREAEKSKEFFDFVPPGCNKYLYEFNHKKSSKKGCIFGKEGFEISKDNWISMVSLCTNHMNGQPGCKTVGNFPI